MRLRTAALLGLAPLIFPAAVVAQTSILTGRVVDTRGEPIIGANVVLQGTRLGAVADLDGNYRLSVPAGTYRVVFSAVSYQRRLADAVLAPGQTLTLNARLNDDVLGSDEVVVTGSGAATLRRELGIDVESVGGDLVDSRTTPSVSTALIGKIPGVQITESATPGAENLIILRGINSFGSARPLLLIDGAVVPSDMLTTLNPSTIERIEIVKGAAASTLYGAQGANGVIQVFLKRGRAGTSEVNVSSSLASSSFQRGNFELATLNAFPVDANGNLTGLTRNPSTRLYTAIEQSSAPGSVTKNAYRLGGQDLPLYDNLDALYGPALSTQNAISASGGSNRITYFASYGYTDQRGIETSTGQRKNSARLSIGAPLSSQLTVNASATVNSDQYRNETGSGNSVLSTLGSVLSLPRYIDLREPDSTGSGFQYRPQQFIGQTGNNPFFNKEYRDTQTDRLRMLGNLQLNYRPFRALELDYKLGAVQTNLRGNAYQFNVEQIPASLRSPILSPQGSASSTSTNTTTFTSTASAYLRSDFKRDFGISAPIRSTTQFTFDYRRTNSRYVEASGSGLPPIRSLATVRALTTKESDQSDSRFVTYGALLNQKFDFGETAGFEVGGRADQSSAFEAGEGVVFFPRANGYVRLVPFLSPGLREHLTEAKFRMAYGSAGTQPGAYDRIITLNQSLIGNTAYFATPATLSNPDLTVERSNEFEAGVDLNYSVNPRYLSSIGLNVTYWSRKTEDAINSLPVAPSTGSASVLDNGYAFSSRGVDLGLQTVWLSQRNFSWSSTFNFSKQQSRVDDIEGPLTERVITTNGLPRLVREGEDVGAFYGYRAVRSLDEVNPATGQRLIAAADAYKYGFVDGKAVNVETQRVLFRPYQELLGSPTPDFVLTMRNDFQVLRDISVGVQLDWNSGGVLYNATRQRLYQYNLSGDNQVPVEIVASTANPAGGQLLRPINPATNAAFDGPQAYAAYYQSLYQTSNANEYFIEDASYVKLREVSVNIQLASTLRRMGLVRPPRVRLELSGRNLFTFSDYKGFDPEVNEGGVNVATRGYDYYSYPNNRTYSAALNFTF